MRNSLVGGVSDTRLVSGSDVATGAECLDGRSARQLVDAALAENWDSDERWKYIRELHRRGDRDAYDTARELATSNVPEEREVAVDVLGQLGARDNYEDRPFREATVDFLIGLLATERAPRVLSSAATALGHLDHASAIAPLVALRGHTDSGVRFGVVLGLHGHDDDTAIRALIELSTDSDEEVRDWATFGLGTMVDSDSPEIRAALAARLDDPHEDTSAEAVAGLAKRGDTRALEPLLVLLETNQGPLVDEAAWAMAVHTGDGRLRPYIEALWSDQADSVYDTHPLRLAAERLGLVDRT
jgi:HEAT repeat protein